MSHELLQNKGEHMRGKEKKKKKKQKSILWCSMKKAYLKSRFTAHKFERGGVLQESRSLLRVILDMDTCTY